VGELGGFLLDLEQHGACWHLAGTVGRTAEDRYATLVGDVGQGEGLTVGRDRLRFEGGAFPAELVEQLLQLEFAKQFLEAGGVECHCYSFPAGSGQAHGADELGLLLLVLIVNHAQTPVFAQRKNEVEQLVVADASLELAVEAVGG